MAELIGVKEIATMADVSSAAVANWLKRHSDCPIPVEKMGSGPVFDSDEVAAWLKGRNKQVKPLGFEDTLWKAADKLRGSPSLTQPPGLLPTGPTRPLDVWPGRSLRPPAYLRPRTKCGATHRSAISI